MKVLFIASECVPFIKTGGLADVIGSLPKELRKLGIDARVILPKYKAIPNHYREKMVHLTHFNLQLGWRNLYCGIEHLEEDGVPFYFIDNQNYFYRESIYGYGDSFDEAERFTFFSQAVLESLPYLQFQPEILHLNDWQTALIPLFLKTHYVNHDDYMKIRTIFTIHNLKYQGIFQQDILKDLLDIDPSDPEFSVDGIEYYGRVNFMKAGLNYANLITTVSETYAKEIQYPFFGEGLDGLLRNRNQDLYGIINGIDVERFPRQQSKQENKVKLQEMLRLPTDPHIPMISLISRLVSQKGIDLVVHVLDEILQQNLQFVVLGTGEQKYEQIFLEASNRYPKKLSVHITFDEPFSHMIYAASDLFLMPSLFEPCGLSQLIALHYGAIPIVRETGGLKDTVQSFNEYNGEGNGFSFTHYNAHDMLYTIKRALSIYHQPPLWNKIKENIKASDFTWKKSAEEYVSLYQLVLQR
ncbi:glycogen synthase GlgA [Tepidibacillus decaturensis]|uniref:Glycogen synthase n=1 Tax=Tepidibacillus decaturensis TaxID=1413211 RepID=A0A135L3N3_9BACI|nr:glycogen synthase GlgA [Tepidibacillus decaturensis]KXG43551.1 glycogen synthase [Tepidibacillus decaturensis]